MYAKYTWISCILLSILWGAASEFNDIDCTKDGFMQILKWTPHVWTITMRNNHDTKQNNGIRACSCDDLYYVMLGVIAKPCRNIVYI